MTSLVVFTVCLMEDSGERRNDCTGVRAALGRRKFLAVVRFIEQGRSRREGKIGIW